VTGFEYADISEHNAMVDDSYLPRWLAYRVCDGTYKDKHFDHNNHWAGTSKKLIGMTPYIVWPPSESNATVSDTLTLAKSMIGTNHRYRVTIMMDVESWGRSEYHRDFSRSLEGMRQQLVSYLFSLRPAYQKLPGVRAWYLAMDNRRVWGYGNLSDLGTMAHGVKWKNVVVANYTTNQFKYQGMIARQYTDQGTMRPFGHPVDLNRTPFSYSAFARRAGLGVLKWSYK
jgi:hypothetical protein